MGVSFAVFSALFFVAGALFCRYVVIKTIANYMLGFADAKTAPMLAMGQYLDLIRDLMLAFGAVFELPLLIYFLALVGMVTHRSLWTFNRWFSVIALVVGAVLTPTPDVPTQLTMAIPMVLLYNLSIILAWTVTRRREKAAQAKHRGILINMDHPLSDDLRQVANPMRFSESTIVHDKHPPLLGEHTSELLRELGFDDAAIDNLKRTGVV
jgi:hypothetical protein